MAQIGNDLPHFGIALTSIVSSIGSRSTLDSLQEEKAKLGEMYSFGLSSSPVSSGIECSTCIFGHTPQTERISIRPRKSDQSNVRLNKFVRRLHDMLTAERGRGVVEWRRGLLVLHSINCVFSNEILPTYFNTRNFKTFRRQLNYYGALIQIRRQLKCIVRRMFRRDPLGDIS
jgi:hypothetical protein